MFNYWLSVECFDYVITLPFMAIRHQNSKTQMILKFFNLKIVKKSFLENLVPNYDWFYKATAAVLIINVLIMFVLSWFHTFISEKFYFPRR